MRSFVSLFSGAGGIDCGFEAAGFTTMFATDVDRVCVETLESNISGRVLQEDVANITPRLVLGTTGLRVKELDVLAAGPPCQPFSKSANWRYGRPLGLDDPRSETLRHLMRVIEGMLPRVVVIENVPGFATGDKPGSALVERAFARINSRCRTRYRISKFILDAAEFGVPQHRKRFFLIADRLGLGLEPPPPTHGRIDAEGRKPFINAWSAIGDLTRVASTEDLSVKGRWADLLPTIPEGENYLWHTSQGGGRELFGWRTRYWSFLLKLAKNRPSWTLPASPSQNTGPFHWDNRLLSSHELARLQSFPDTWEFVGTRAQKVRQIGNAVPPLLAEIIARRIRVQLLAERPNRTEPRLRQEQRRRVPPPSTVARVPSCYRHLEDDHAPHPGHGLGPGARQRLRDEREVAARQRTKRRSL